MTSKILGSGTIFDIVAYEVDVGGGVMKTFEKAVRAPGVRLIIQNESGSLLLSKEYRYELGYEDYRLPGGKVFDTKHAYLDFLSTGGDIEDAILTAAKLEAREELGIRLSSVSFLTKQACGATVERDLYYVVSDSYEEHLGNKLEEGELVLGYERYDKESLYALLEKGFVSEGRSASVLLQYISGNLSL